MSRAKTVGLLAVFCATLAFARGDDLESGFVTPSDSTRPRCYWYWLDGHISKSGITQDLEAMKRVGIGEAYIGMIDAQSGVAPNPDLKPLSDPWWDTMAHAIREGTRLNVDIGIFNSPGWSQSGGPWVQPEQSMRYLALPEIRLTGPRRFDGKLPVPNGLFQDVAVMAFPVPEGEQAHAGIQTRTATTVDIEFPIAIVARSVTVQPTQAVQVSAELSASDDGRAYRAVKRFDLDRHQLDVNVGPVPLAAIVETLPATRARFFRLTLSRECTIGEVQVCSAARVERFMEKQLAKVFQDPQPPFEFYTWPLHSEPDQPALKVAPGSVRDLSKQMDADGTLHWDVPAGDWVVLRAGMRPTGSTNGPAPAAATGLEVDKMNRTHLMSHFDNYLGELIRRVPDAERRSWKHVVADSYERGPQNWTDGFTDDFHRRYGYDPLPFLPVMTGRIVGSVDQSDRFLWDLRRLIADRVAIDYVGGLHDLCAAHGMKMWLENYGHFGFPSEFLAYGGACDEIAGEFWVSGTLGSIELRAASSAAHIYGKNAVWAEAFTGGPLFVNSPRDLKSRGDWALCQGVNQFMLHVYVHQPDERKPGMSAWFGSEFNRHNTWFEMSRSWIDYQRRCTHLLQQGLHVADVAYFIGEDAPKMTGQLEPPLPPGYDFDFINAEVLLTRAKVQDGRLVLTDGMNYRVLVLPPNQSMRPAVLSKIATFVDEGLTVVGALPARSPSLQNYPEADAEVRRLCGALQGKVSPATDLRPLLKQPADVAGLPERRLIFTHRHSEDAEIYFLSNQSDTTVSAEPVFRVEGMDCELWRAESGEIERVECEPVGRGSRVPLQLDPHGSVFVVFRRSSSRAVIPAAPVAGNLQIRKAIYEAVDGTASADVTAHLSQQVRGGTLRSAVTNDALGGDPAFQHVKRLRLDYTLNGKPISVVLQENDPINLSCGDAVPGPWRVDFPAQTVTVNALMSWTQRPEPKVKYYSGTATYHTTFEASDIGQRVLIDLGDAHTIAEITLNGHTFPAVWMFPYQADVTSVIRPGVNELKVRVANTWHNRLVGQAREPEQFGDQRVWASATPRYGPNEPLHPSGLIGPVVLRGAHITSIKE